MLDELNEFQEQRKENNRSRIIRIDDNMKETNIGLSYKRLLVFTRAGNWVLNEPLIGVYHQLTKHLADREVIDTSQTISH